ncbi:MAG: SRPBCC domain-containing protein [Candidatus Eiseniibacteriota bacterium]
MDARRENEPNPTKNRTTVERKSDREVVVTRTINGSARIVFEAFAKAELLKRWWVPQSMGMTLLSCEVDARVGGKYRLVFDHGGPEPAAFFGTYVEVKPYSRLAWTNDEGGEGGSVTTVTFEEAGGKTLVILRESYPSKEALDAAGTGAADAMVETFDQLDELLVALGESSGRS